jgi:hypothetical protein
MEEATLAKRAAQTTDQLAARVQLLEREAAQVWEWLRDTHG